MLKPALEAHFARYADHHRHPVNRLTHEIAIPLLIFHVLAMLSWIVIAAPYGHNVTLGHLVFALVIAWYLWLDTRLGVLLALVFGLCFPLAAVTPRPVVFGFAAVGWLLHFGGYSVWEKRPLAFFTQLFEALIGPLFFAATIVGLWPSERAAHNAMDLGGSSVR